MSVVQLVPGLHVVRREGATVQVGLDAPSRVVLRAEPQTLDLLERLRHGVRATSLDDADGTDARVVRALAGAGLLVEERPRPSGSVAIVEGGHLAERLHELLGSCDVRVDAIVSADLVVACTDGPLPRAVVDPWIAEGTPHLVVSGTGEPGSLRVGPLVEPGRTACLRCVDAAEAQADPRRPLVVEQLAMRPAGPIDALTTTVALALAARDVTAYLRGEVAATWSATLDAHVAVPEVRRRERHPECGCCWDELPY